MNPRDSFVIVELFVTENITFKMYSFVTNVVTMTFPNIFGAMEHGDVAVMGVKKKKQRTKR